MIKKVVLYSIMAVSAVCAAVAFFLPRGGSADDGVVVVKAPVQSEAARPESFPDPEANWIKLPEGTNLAMGKKVLSGEVTEVYSAANAVDGDTNTYWESKGVPAEIVICLGASYNVKTVAVRLNPAAVWEARAQGIAVYVSADGESFTPAVPDTKYDFTPDTGNMLRIDFEPTQASYVKVQFSSNSSSRSAGAQAAEILVFE